VPLLLLRMYSREQSAQIRQAFWTSFGKYMSPVPNAGGEHINWVNYKTGIKHIYLRMDADREKAYIGLEITHADLVTQQLYFEQILSYKSLLENADEWEWSNNLVNENGKPFCAISKTITNVNVFRQPDWPQIISFLKSSVIEIDAFWYIVKDLVEIL
jgi:hypothetical protein